MVRAEAAAGGEGGLGIFFFFFPTSSSFFIYRCYGYRGSRWERQNVSIVMGGVLLLARYVLGSREKCFSFSKYGSSVSKSRENFLFFQQVWEFGSKKQRK